MYLSVHAQCSRDVWSVPPELPQENFDHMRALQTPSESSINYIKFMATGDSSRSHFSEPLPSDLAFVFEVLLQNCLMKAAVLNGLCLQDMKL